MNEQQKTPLYSEHIRLGGKMAEFAGWMMPLWYPTGQSAEHHAVRKVCGLFDICHMGEFEIAGTDSLSFLSRMLSNNVSGMADHQAMYHFLLNDEGGVIDDCILYRFEASRWMLVVNAGNIRTDFDWLVSHAPSTVRIENISDQTVKLDLQGPAAPKVMSKWIPRDELLNLKFFRFIPKINIDGMEVLVSRTGYTGDVGFELYADLRNAVNFWNLLLSEGKQYGILPCGLGARDTLRLEAGLPLHGHELKPDRPGLGHPWEFALNWDHDFIGKEKLIRIRDKGIQYHVLPFVMEGRRKAMTGWSVLYQNEKAGTVLSGGISPSLNNTPIGFMGVRSRLEKDAEIVFMPEIGPGQLVGRVGVSPFLQLTARQKMQNFIH